MANCPGCGGLMSFNIELQTLKCSSCEGLLSPYDADTVVSNAADTYETTVFTCPQCGGELSSTDHDISGNCSYCGSPVVFESKIVNEKRPDYIIPFGVTKAECGELYFESVKKNPFAPKELKDPEFIDGFRGIYVPYWIYDIKQDGRFDVTASHTENHGSYSYIYKDKITGRNATEYRHIMHDASSVLLDDISEKVEPFETIPNRDIHRRTECFQKFSTGFLPGFYAEPADVPAETYNDYAENIANTRTNEFIKTHSALKKYNITLKPEQLGTAVKGRSLAMMPVWFLSYRKNDRVAYAAVNGQTGRVISDTPIDFKMFTGRLLITAAIIFAILCAIMIFAPSLPVSITLISVIMSYIVTRYCHDDIRVLKGREEDAVYGRLRKLFGSTGWTFGFFIVILVILAGFKVLCFFDNDLISMVDSFLFGIIASGFSVAHLVRAIRIYVDLGKIVKDKTAAHYICPMINLAASVFGAIVLLMSPAEDFKYYLAGLSVIILEMVSFVFILKNYNRIATRPLPQFSIHKGGDDRA